MINSWIGTNIRKGERIGVVIHDSNGGVFRILTVKFLDSEHNDELWLSHTGPDPKETHNYEWFSDETNSSNRGVKF